MGRGQLVEGGRLGAAHRLGKVDPDDGRRLRDLCKQARIVQIEGGDDAFLRTIVAQMSGKGAGIDAGDSDNAMFSEKLGQALGGAPIGGREAHVVHNQTAKSQAIGLKIVRVNAVIANLRVGHGDDLASIGGVGDNLQVTFERGVEANLAERLALSGN